MNQRNSSSPIPDQGLLRQSAESQPSINIELAEPEDVTADPQLNFEVSDKDRDRMSVLTTQTDFSTETAVVEVVEKRTISFSALGRQSTGGDNEFGLLDVNKRLQFDFGSKFSLGGLGLPITEMDIRAGASVESKSSMGMLTQDVPKASSIETSSTGMTMGNVDVDMEMKSALDRLMEDVAGTGAPPDESMMTDEYDESFDHCQSRDNHANAFSGSEHPKMMKRAATDSVLLQANEADGVMSRTASGSSTISLPPPPVPPKENIRAREQITLEKRREARRLEEEDEDMYVPRGATQRHLGVGRPSRRRSMSTGDAEVLGGGAKKRGDALLDVAPQPSDDGPLADSIERELQKLVDPPKKSVSCNIMRCDQSY
jgi:hypothetical protein